MPARKRDDQGRWQNKSICQKKPAAEVGRKGSHLPWKWHHQAGNLGEMTNKGDTVPDHHQPTKALQIQPANAAETTAPDIPKQIAEGTKVLDMGKLMNNNTLRTSVRL